MGRKAECGRKGQGGGVRMRTVGQKRGEHRAMKGEEGKRGGRRDTNLPARDLR